MKLRKNKATPPIAGGIGGMLRLSRNLAGAKFPAWSSEPELKRVKEKILKAAKAIDPSATYVPFDNAETEDFSAWIDDGEAAPSPSSGFIFFKNAPDVRVAVNATNHLEIEYSCNGIDLASIWPKIDALDDRFAEQLDYAWSPRLGYLTANSTQVGTGLLAETLVQLVGFHILQEMDAVKNALERLDCKIRSIDIPECPFPAALYRISNRITIGKDEPTLIADVMRVSTKILLREWQARSRLAIGHSPLFMADYVSRALAAAQAAYLVSPSECAQLLLVIRFGIEMNLVKGIRLQELDKHVMFSQKANLVDEKFGYEVDPGIRIRQAYADFLHAALKSAYVEVAL